MIQKMKLSCGSDTTYTGYADEKDTWNGWLKPVFERDVASDILNDMVSDPYSDISHWEYDEDADAFIVYDENIKGSYWYKGEELVIDEPYVYDIFYPIGSSEWCWEKL